MTVVTAPKTRLTPQCVFSSSGASARAHPGADSLRRSVPVRATLVAEREPVDVGELGIVDHALHDAEEETWLYQSSLSRTVSDTRGSRLR